jgi:hypothetical protein
MYWLHRGRWLLMLAMAALVVWGASLARTWTFGAVRTRLSHRYQQQIASLPEPQAVRLVRRLGEDDSQWLDVLFAASGDERPAVAAAAERHLRELVDRWAEMPPGESSPIVASLAGVLAQQAPQLSAERRRLAHALAQRLIEWPLDARRVDVAQLIADCESVLLLPRAEPLERGRDSLVENHLPEPTTPLGQSLPTPLPSPAEPPEVRVAATPSPPGPQPQPAPPPASLPDANREVSVEPRPFSATGPMRISDD